MLHDGTYVQKIVLGLVIVFTHFSAFAGDAKVEQRLSQLESKALSCESHQKEGEHHRGGIKNLLASLQSQLNAAIAKINSQQVNCDNSSADMNQKVSALEARLKVLEDNAACNGPVRQYLVSNQILSLDSCGKVLSIVPIVASPANPQ